MAEIAAISDASPAALEAALADVPSAVACAGLDELLSRGLDGLVIATPSALHAAQAATALGRGTAVFCQKPLGRNFAETSRVVEVARAANRLLGVDFSYRFTDGLKKTRELAQSGALGQVYAAELTFHNAYGPDKPWFYDRSLSGGGCVMDLGVHLVDLASWVVDSTVTGVTSRMFAGGAPIKGDADGVEDFAVARLDFANGATAQLSCSWKVPAGCDAIIGATFYGTRGAVRWQNVNGSFFDFRTERLEGTRSVVISEPPDDWGPRALIEWARRLANGAGFDSEVESVAQVAATLDRMYGVGIQQGWPDLCCG
jgi:predicted dehydrogenase